MARRVILTKALKRGVKHITGEVLQETFDKLTITVIDPSGNKRIKSYKKEDYNIQVVNE